MKNIFTVIIASICLFSLPLTGVIGCKSAKSAQIVAFKTIQSVSTTVDAAAKAYVDVWKDGNISAETDAKVTELHEKYRKAFVVAITSVEFNWEAPATDELVKAATEFITLVKELL